MNNSRNSYTASLKRKVIIFAEANGNRAASREFGVPESNVRLWRQKRNSLFLCADTRKRFSGPKNGRHPEVDAHILEFVRHRRSNALPVTWEIMRQEANEFAISSGISQEVFTASRGWGYRLMGRTGLSLRRRKTVCLKSPLDLEQNEFPCVSKQESLDIKDTVVQDYVPIQSDAREEIPVVSSTVKEKITGTVKEEVYAVGCTVKENTFTPECSIKEEIIADDFMIKEEIPDSVCEDHEEFPLQRSFEDVNELLHSDEEETENRSEIKVDNSRIEDENEVEDLGNDSGMGRGSEQRTVLGMPDTQTFSTENATSECSPNTQTSMDESGMSEDTFTEIEYLAVKIQQKMKTYSRDSKNITADISNLDSFDILSVSECKCNACSTTYQSNSELEAHIIATHSEDCMYCKFCTVRFDNELSLLQHYCQVCVLNDIEKNNCLVTCPFCIQQFPVSEFKKHLRYHKNVCHICVVFFQNSEDYEDHKKTHTQSFLCEKCGKTLKSRRNFRIHMKMHNSVAKFKCEDCGVVRKRKSILKQHLYQVHPPDGTKIFCKVCKNLFRSTHSLYVHMQVHSNNNTFKCNICGKYIKWRKNLKAHRRRHLALLNSNIYYKDNIHKFILQRFRRYQCDICQKYFISKFNLSRHLKRHSFDISAFFICELCGNKYKSLESLKRHVESHAGIKRFTCKYCEKRFTTKAGKDYHESIHTGKRPFKCYICNKSFKTKPALSWHLNVHLDKKPHKCKICEKSFLRKAYLTTHLRIHAGEKHFSCDICSHSFVQKFDMIRHRLTHFTGKPFKCNKCGVCYRHKQNLKIHNQKKKCKDVADLSV